MKIIRNIFFLFFCLALLIIGFLVIRKPGSKEEGSAVRKVVEIKGIKIFIDIADTPEKKTKGLSGRNTLAKNEGVLFEFVKDTRPSFWMKEMNFPLDIIWINDGKILQIDKNVPFPSPGIPDSQLPYYSPKEPIDYVLEVNAGFSDKNNFQVGDLVDLSQI